MKNFIKKSAVTTLSAIGIFSAMPSAFCAPVKECNLDCNSIMIVGKYLKDFEDMSKLEQVNKKYADVLKRFHFNPVKLDSEKQCKIFPSLVTYYVGENKRDFISKIPSDNIKVMIYRIGSFNSSQFREVLVNNNIQDANGEYTGEWHRELEINGGNPMNGCRLSFTKVNSNTSEIDKEIIFDFNPCKEHYLREGVLCNGVLSDYNNFLKKCGIEENEGASIPLSSTEVVISDNITRIRYGAFRGFSDLTKVVIPESVKNIEESAFVGCRNLVSVNIPKSVKSIGSKAFYGCDELRRIDISDGVIKICDYAFKDCETLEKISIPTSVRSIGKGIFEGCVNLSKIEFNGSVYKSVDSFMKAFNDYRENLKQ